MKLPIEPGYAPMEAESVPEIPTLASLGVIVGVLAVTTTTSLIASRNTERDSTDGAHADETPQSEGVDAPT